MKFEKAKYLFSILDKMTVGFIGIFSVSSSRKKRDFIRIFSFEEKLVL